jgi:hypothetical protein
MPSTPEERSNMATNKGTIDVRLNKDGTKLKLSRQGGGSNSITVRKSEAPAEITFSAASGLSFKSDCFSLDPSPPAGDFSWTPTGDDTATSLVVTDNDTDTQDTTYEYTVCAYKDSDGSKVCADPEIINKAG